MIIINRWGTFEPSTLLDYMKVIFDIATNQLAIATISTDNREDGNIIEHWRSYQHIRYLNYCRYCHKAVHKTFPHKPSHQIKTSQIRGDTFKHIRVIEPYITFRGEGQSWYTTINEEEALTRSATWWGWYTTINGKEALTRSAIWWGWYTTINREAALTKSAIWRGWYTTINGVEK